LRTGAVDGMEEQIGHSNTKALDTGKDAEIVEIARFAAALRYPMGRETSLCITSVLAPGELCSSK